MTLFKSQLPRKTGSRLSNLKSQEIVRHLVFLTLLVSLSPCLLVKDTLAQAPAATTKGRAGNYCIECHVEGDLRLESALEWQGGIGREQVLPCPTLKRLREEIYYTESLLGAMTNSGQGLRASGISTAPMDKRVLARLEIYERLQSESVTALAPVETELKSLRLQLNKSFSQMYQGWDHVNLRWAIVAALVVTLLLAGTAIWRLSQSPLSNLQSQITKPNPVALFAFLIVFALFALPVFSAAAPASTAQTAEQAARQKALNAATTAAESAERASARAWMLARVGASWAQVDRAKGQEALAASLEAFDQFQMNAPAYWGLGRRLEESAVTWPTGQDAALDAADRIAVAASRAWALRAIAGEWGQLSGDQAESILRQALMVANKNANAYYRDIDLYGIAVELARIDIQQGLKVARRAINDPSLKMAALRDMAALQAPSDPQAARYICDSASGIDWNAAPVERTWLRQTLAICWTAAGSSSGYRELTEAHQIAITEIKSQDRAFVLRNLAAAWSGVSATKAQQTAESIDAAYPEVKASALLEVGQFDLAVEQAKRIDRAYRRDHALAAIARAWAAVAPGKALDVASAIQDAYLRADVQRAAALGWAKSNPDQALQTAQAIAIPYVKAQALVELGAFDSALALADQLQDTYPMRQLAVAWAKTDLDRALQAVEKIQRDVDRADALREISVIVAAKDKAQADALFDRAFKVAQAVRRSGDPFASAEALRQLGVAWTPIDRGKAAQAFAAAFESAQRVSVKY